MSGPRLLPNLGAEEGPDWRRALTQPRVALAARLWRGLFGDDASLALEGGAADGLPDALTGPEPVFPWLPRDAVGVPWWADADARGAPEFAGLEIVGPDPETLARVHDKAFALAAAEAEGLTPRPLRGLWTALSPALCAEGPKLAEEIASALDAWPAWARAAWTLKPRLGSSGRGRVAGRGAPDPEAIAAAAPRLARRGGALLEPWLVRKADFSTQLHLGPEGVALLGCLEQLVSASGVWRGHRGELDSRGRIFSGREDEEALREAAAAVANAARAEGLWGPCSVDAFRFVLPEQLWDDPAEPRSLLRPVVELNARFTMGTVAIGLVRRLLPTVKEALGLRPGDRRAFALCLEAPEAGWAASEAAAGPGALHVPLAPPGEGGLAPALLFATSSADLDRALDASPEEAPA